VYHHLNDDYGVRYAALIKESKYKRDINLKKFKLEPHILSDSHKTAGSLFASNSLKDAHKQMELLQQLIYSHSVHREFV